MNEGPTTAFLADDHPLVLRGLVDLLSAERDFTVIGTAIDGKSALEKIIDAQPDIAVLDLVMPRMSGLDILHELAQLGSPVRVIFLSALISDEQSVQAIASGAFGILLKESAPETLIECMRLVRGGRRWFPGNLFNQKTARTNELGKRKSTDELTSREREIAALVAEGLSNKRIAALLNVTEGTVKIHLHNVFAKLDVSNRTALATMVVSMRNATFARHADRTGDDRGTMRNDEEEHPNPTSSEDDAGRH
jgi:DNA-binding NarL/FixJ family response regulator